jgi:hypothetical protein
MTKIAGFFGAQDHPAPPTAHDAGLPPAPAATSGTAPEPTPVPAATPEPPKKKRGFWSKLFGIGKDDRKDERKSDERKRDERDKKKGGR